MPRWRWATLRLSSSDPERPAVDPALLPTIERYLDAVPRTAVTAEPVGPFTLFIRTAPGWRYYARPALGSRRFADGDFAAVFARQRALEQPTSIEWVDENTPALAAAAEAAGLRVHRRPLMVLDGEPPAIPAPKGFELRHLKPSDPLLVAANAVAAVAFQHAEPVVGPQGIEALGDMVAGENPANTAFLRSRLEAGWTVMAAMLHDGAPVAVGFHQPLAGVSEVAGVATLPAHRRRGLAAALTAYLARHALAGGAATVFLSASDDQVARVYARAGFCHAATSCETLPDASP